MSVRLAARDDAPAVAELLTELGAPGVDAEEAVGRLLRESYSVFIAERGGEALGLVALRTDLPFGHARPLAHISALVTLDRARRSGVAGELVGAAVEYARRQGCTGVELTCGLRPEREAAHLFYEAQGFERAGIRYWLPVMDSGGG